MTKIEVNGGIVVHESAGPQDGVRPQDRHTWEGDATQVFHCTTCGLVTTSTDTVFPCLEAELA